MAHSASTDLLGPAIRRGEYKTLEAWRGVAALAVVVYHASLINTARFPELAASGFYRGAAQGYLGVYVFFVISGYCIANAACRLLDRENRVRQYFWARARRILPPCWCALALTAGLSIAAGAVAARRHMASTLATQDVLHQSAGYFVSNLTLTQLLLHQRFLLIVCWTLCYEAAFYIVVGLALAWRWKKTGQEDSQMLTALHVLTVGVLLTLLVRPGSVAYPLDLWPMFGFGVILFDMAVHPGAAAPRWWAAGAAVLAVLFALTRDVPLGVFHYSSRLTMGFTLGFAGLLLVLHRVDTRFADAKAVRALAWVGLFSYSLYLVHYPCLGVINQVFKAAHVPQSAHGLLLLMAVALAVGVARVFYQGCERPFLKKVRRHLPAPAGTS